MVAFMRQQVGGNNMVKIENKKLKTIFVNVGLVILAIALCYLLGGWVFIQENKAYLVAFVTVMAFITIMPLVPKRETKDE